MARHKTAHRKALEAHEKHIRTARQAEVAAVDPASLKPNAAANLKAATRAALWCDGCGDEGCEGYHWR